jgi:hypothetical protein
VFVYDFVTLERPFTAVAGELANDRGAGALTGAAVAVASATPDGSAEALRFEVGAVRTVGGAVVVPIRWTPASGEAPFRHLEGSLHVEPFQRDTSYLSVSASCDEATTGLGRREDTGRRRREAEMSVRMFLRSLAAALEIGRDRDGPTETA